MLAEMSVFLAKKQASFTRKRVAKLSDPSSTMSYWETSGRILSAIDVLVVGLDRDFRVDRRQGFAAGLHFRQADRGRGVQDLPLQVGEIDDIAIDETNGADTGGSKIESGRRAEPPGADEQDLRLAQLQLALAADIAEDNLPAVSLNLLFSEFHLEDVLR